MKSKVIIVYWMIGIALASLIVRLSNFPSPLHHPFDSSFMNEVSMAIFGGSALAIVISSIEYYNERTLLMREIFSQINSIRSAIGSLKYYELEYPKDIIRFCFADQFHNENIEIFGVFDDSSRQTEGQQQLINYYLKRSLAAGIDDLPEPDQSWYDKKLSNLLETMRESIQTYIDLADISLSELYKYANQVQFFSPTINTEITNMVNDIARLSQPKNAAHFREYLRAENGNHVVIFDMLLEAQADYFEEEEASESWFHSVSIYRTVYDDMSFKLDLLSAIFNKSPRPELNSRKIPYLITMGPPLTEEGTD